MHLLIHGKELQFGPPKKKISKVLNFIIKKGTEEEIKNTLNSLSGHLINKKSKLDGNQFIIHPGVLYYG